MVDAARCVRQLGDATEMARGFGLSLAIVALLMPGL
jgi:hypothetical protein